MYKCTGPTHPPKEMAHRSNATKGVGSRRLPTTHHGAKPQVGFGDKKINVMHQDEPTKSDPTRQHYQFATGKRQG